MGIALLAAQAPYSLTPIEACTGLVFGTQSGVSPLADGPQGHSLRSAIEAVVRRAMDRGPSFVSFSGGRDSSAILAIAVHLARREGLPMPVPVTLHIAGSKAADEREWQDAVLQHLGLRARNTISISDELGVVGPVSRSVMRQHGLLFPPNAFMHDLILSECSGGTLMTGGGGDELLDESIAGRNALVLAGRLMPTPRDVGRIAASAMARRAYDRRRARFVPRLPWLSESGQDQVATNMVRDWGPPHEHWSERVRRLARARSMAALGLGQDLLAVDHGMRIVHPFLDADVLAAAIEVGGKTGLGGRTAAMSKIVGDLLPAGIIGRQTKASFGDALWTGHSLSVARDDETIDAVRSDPAVHSLIDIDGLRAAWRHCMPHHGTSLLLQAAFMALGGHRRD